MILGFYPDGSPDFRGKYSVRSKQIRHMWLQRMFLASYGSRIGKVKAWGKFPKRSMASVPTKLPWDFKKGRAVWSPAWSIKNAEAATRAWTVSRIFDGIRLCKLCKPIEGSQAELVPSSKHGFHTPSTLGWIYWRFWYPLTCSQTKLVIVIRNRHSNTSRMGRMPRSGAISEYWLRSGLVETVRRKRSDDCSELWLCASRMQHAFSDPVTTMRVILLFKTHQSSGEHYSRVIQNSSPSSSQFPQHWPKQLLQRHKDSYMPVHEKKHHCKIQAPKEKGLVRHKALMRGKILEEEFHRTLGGHPVITRRTFDQVARNPQKENQGPLAVFPGQRRQSIQVIRKPQEPSTFLQSGNKLKASKAETNRFPIPRTKDSINGWWTLTGRSESIFAWLLT